MCRKAITTGEQLFVVDENKFMCKQDYLLNKTPGTDLSNLTQFNRIYSCSFDSNHNLSSILRILYILN